MVTCMPHPKLIDSTYKHEFINTQWNNKHFLIIKTYTHKHHGPLIVCTTYSRPYAFLPLLDLDRNFDLNYAYRAFLKHTRDNYYGTQLYALYTKTSTLSRTWFPHLLTQQPRYTRPSPYEQVRCLPTTRPYPRPTLRIKSNTQYSVPSSEPNTF